MTFEDMKTMMGELLSDPSNQQVKAERRRILLNLAYQDIWNILIRNGRYLRKKTYTVTFATGSQTKIIDATNEDIQKIVYAQLEDGTPIDIVEEESAKRSVTPCLYISEELDEDAGNPDVKRREIRLGWYTEPETSFTVTLTACLKINTFQASDDDKKIIHDIPEEYHSCIVYRACMMALGVDNDSREMFRELYQEQMDMMLAAGAAHEQRSVIDETGY